VSETKEQTFGFRSSACDNNGFATAIEHNRRIEDLVIARVAEASSTPNIIGTSPQHLIATISVPSISDSSFSALIDCGCSHSFISSDLVAEYNIPRNPLSKPLKLVLFDGSFSGYITSSVDLPIRFSDNSSDVWTFLETTLSSECHFALGLDWLRSRNPTINWSDGSVSLGTPSSSVGKTTLAAYKYVMAAPSAKELLAPFASPESSLPNSPTLVSVDRDPRNYAPGEQSVEPFKSDIEIIDASAFCSLIEEGPLTFGIVMPSIESPILAKSSIPSDVLDDDDPLESLPEHIPDVYADFADVFSGKNADKLPPRRPYDHAIDLDPGTTPPYGPIYKQSESELKVIKNFIDEYLAKGFIRPSQSPAGSPIVFAKKKDGSLRLCIDYRGINRITRKNRYPLPRIDELLDRLSRAQIFSKIDLKSGYNLVRVADGDEWKTAFRTRYGSYEFLVMHFGLTNAPATFQHFMNDTFYDLLDKFVAAYLDDLIIYTESSDLADHIGHVREVLLRCRKSGLFANAKKCEFHVRTIEYVGYIVSPDGLSMDPAKVKAISDWPALQTLREVQSFLGFANFYRRFISGFARIAKPLTMLTRKDVPFQWSSTCAGAFGELKRHFVASPILAHYHPDRQTIIETDASDYAVAAVLSQVDPSTAFLHPIAFYSRSMSSAELNYEIYDKELLAIFAAFKEWRHYLEGIPDTIEVITDHKNLEYFASTKLLTRRQARWSEYLSGFSYTVRYRPGKQGVKPDSLTRRSDVYPQEGEGAYELANPQNMRTLFSEGQLITSARATYALCKDVIEYDVLLRATILDSESLRSDIIGRLRSDELAKTHSESPQLPWSKSNSGLLLYEGRVYVPDFNELRLRILREKHDHPTAGHQGFRKTFELVRREFYWPQMRKFISDYCTTCDTCPRAKPSRHKPYGLLKQLPIPERPWESISLDFIVELPASKSELDSHTYDAILVIVDRLSKMSVFIPTVGTLDAHNLARLYILHVFSKHGIPSDIVSDRGTLFTSNFITSLGQLLGMKLNFSTAYHPESDGQTERMNQSLEGYLRLYCNYQQDNWSDLLPIAEFAYNNAPHSATQVSPFFANYGYNPRATLALDVTVRDPTAHDFSQKLSDLHDYCREQLAVAQAQYQAPADRHRSPIPDSFVPGSKVWLNTKNIKTSRPSKKLDHKRLGPYKILEKISDTAFRLELPRSMRFLHPVFHASLLTPHRSNTIQDRHQPPPPPIEIDGHTEYEVIAILDSKRLRGKIHYLVRWTGHETTAESETWEPADNVSNAQELVEQFHLKYPRKPR
jgi:hypothetical protein